MSSGGSQQTTTTSVPDWLQGAAQGYLGTASQVASQPYTPYNDQRVADLTPLQQSSIQGLGNLAGGTGSMVGNENFLQNLSGGAFMNNPGSADNPYGGFGPTFQKTLGAGLDDITHAYDQGTSAETTRLFNMSGAFGGSAHQNAIANNQRELGRTLGNYTSGMVNDQFNRSGQLAESGLNRVSSNYNQGINQMLGGVGASTGLADAFGRTYQNALAGGNMEQANYQRLLDSLYGDYMDQRNYPNQQLGLLGNAVSSIFGGNRSSTQTTQLPGQDPMSSGLALWMLASGFK